MTRPITHADLNHSVQYLNDMLDPSFPIFKWSRQVEDFHHNGQPIGPSHWILETAPAAAHKYGLIPTVHKAGSKREMYDYLNEWTCELATLASDTPLEDTLEALRPHS